MYIEENNRIFLKIGPRGQITIPIALRNSWGSDIVSMEIIQSDKAVISPVPSIAGSLNAYKKDEHIPFNEIRQHAWQENTNNKL